MEKNGRSLAVSGTAFPQMHQAQCKADECAGLRGASSDYADSFGGYYTSNFGALCQTVETRYSGCESINLLETHMKARKSETTQSTHARSSTSGHQEVRCAVRFPLSLPVELSTGEDDLSGFTRNVSASGVLFALDRTLRVGSDIRFSLRMPHETLGSPQDVVVHCKGRVVRCSSSHNEHLAAATIDDYRFAER